MGNLLSTNDTDEPEPIKLIPEDGRTILCQHNHSCMQNSKKGFSRTFKWCLVLKVILSGLINISKVKSARMFYDKILSWNANKDSFRFAAVFALINSAYKGILCLLRRILQGRIGEISVDKIAAPIAGFLAGLLISFDSKGRRSFLAILMLSRLVDVVQALFIKVTKNKIRKEDHQTERSFNRNDFGLFLWILCSVY